MDIDILPPKFTDASFLRGAFAISGQMDKQGIGTLTIEEMSTMIDINCQWEPHVTNTGLILAYFEVYSRDKFFVLTGKDFLDNIRLTVW